MAGMIVFRSLDEAHRAGFEVYDRTPRGYLVQTRTEGGLALALVELPKPETTPETDAALT
jgi:hypothetical protein